MLLNISNCQTECELKTFRSVSTIRGSLEVPGSSFVQADSVVRGGSEWFSCSGLIGMVRWYGLIRGGSRWLGLEMNLNLE